MPWLLAATRCQKFRCPLKPKRYFLNLNLLSLSTVDPGVVQKSVPSSTLINASSTPILQQKWCTLAIDLLNPSAEAEKRRHKLKRLVQSPNSYFMDVKCPGCFAITTVFSHAQTVVLCGACASVLCQPTGGKARLTEGSSYRRKN
ncbi:uncharacterized protein FIBRA_03712 [Fibroporia radiculosa]|uniref:40S ribosomal protein S27 n=1 Tax=Fibroporia radiculosa TaxID=599839 RepID=J4I9S1_9APHY|nr:uncharacterized protein FIBRA_03712 [Fibroporia radiculosa]CCM01651.1 predicted protein [Fibroporia radiculosa]